MTSHASPPSGRWASFAHAAAIEAAARAAYEVHVMAPIWEHAGFGVQQMYREMALAALNASGAKP